MDIGCKVTTADNGDITIDSTTIGKPVGEYDIVRKMRAGICILGPLLRDAARAGLDARRMRNWLSSRRYSHSRTARAWVQIDLENGYIVADATKGLRGTEIFLGGPFGSTVLGTANVMMAATLAKGRTVIESAACEPEVTDLANCLNKMGEKLPASEALV